MIETCRLKDVVIFIQTIIRTIYFVYTPMIPQAKYIERVDKTIISKDRQTAEKKICDNPFLWLTMEL